MLPFRPTGDGAVRQRTCVRGACVVNAGRAACAVVRSTYKNRRKPCNRNVCGAVAVNPPQATAGAVWQAAGSGAVRCVNAATTARAVQCVYAYEVQVVKGKGQRACVYGACVYVRA